MMSFALFILVVIFFILYDLYFILPLKYKQQWRQTLIIAVIFRFQTEFSSSVFSFQI